MTELIAWAVFLILSTIAALHYLWASGSTWPVATQEQFVRSFIGVQSAKTMPGKRLTVLVATLILAAAASAPWGAALITLPLPSWSKPILLWALFAVFLLRGLSTYGLPNLPRAEPFKTLDRRYFAPLCLVLAAGFLNIALNL